MPKVAKVLERERIRKPYSPAGMCSSFFLGFSPLSLIRLDGYRSSTRFDANLPRIRSPLLGAFLLLRVRSSSLPSSLANLPRRLTCFALSLDYRKMIPTVSVHSSTSRAKMQEWFGRWDAEKKRRRDAKLPLLVPPRSTNYW